MEGKTFFCYWCLTVLILPKLLIRVFDAFDIHCCYACSTAYVLPYPLSFTYAELEVQIVVVVTITVTAQ